MIEHNKLITMTSAAHQHGIPVAAVVRMESEGLLEILRFNGDYFLRRDELSRVADLALTDPKFLTCTCIAGPCRCR